MSQQENRKKENNNNSRKHHDSFHERRNEVVVLHTASCDTARRGRGEGQTGSRCNILLVLDAAGMYTKEYILRWALLPLSPSPFSLSLYPTNV